MIQKKSTYGACFMNLAVKIDQDIQVVQLFDILNPLKENTHFV